MNEQVLTDNMSTQQVKTIKMADVLDSGMHFLAYLKNQFLFILLITILSTVLALGYYYYQKPAYEGSVTFILEEKTGGMSSGIAGLASQFGFDLGGTSGSSGLFAGDNILDILKSRSIIEKVLLSKVDTGKGATSTTLADLYLDFTHLKTKWQNTDKELAEISFSGLGPGKSNSLIQDSVLYIIYTKLNKKGLTVERPNKKSSIIKITLVSGNAVFSKCFTERLLAETKKLYIDIKTSVSAANVARLESRADSLLRVLNSKSYQSASLQILDANMAFKTSNVPVEVSQRDKLVASTLYTEVMKNLEVSRMSLSQQTPIIQLLDSPKYPLDDQKKSLMLLLGIGFIAGLAIGFLICFFTYPSAKTNT